ncbi:MAG: glutamine amidotransferase family, partial [Anaerospora sp.]|nr:glutamine amidotransferase family [Anaerospora sp.]
MITIGVLALQGAFREHCRMVEHLGAQAVEIR